MRLKNIKLLLLAVLLLGSAGCVCRPGVVEHPGTAAVSREELLSRIGERTRYWSSYQANVHIRGATAKGKFRLRAVILAQLPDLLRLEAFTPLGQTAGVLVFNPKGASLWIPSEQVVYQSKRAETLVKHFLGAPVPVETFGYSLVASLPPDLKVKELRPSQAGSGWTISTEESPGHLGFTWSLLSQPPAMKAVSVRQGPLDYTIGYEPATSLEPGQIPGEIRFVSSQWQMEVKVDQMKPGPEIRSGAFDLSAPAGIRRVRLSEAP